MDIKALAEAISDIEAALAVPEGPEPHVGMDVWVYDVNYRVYHPAPKGQIWGNYNRELSEWRPARITGETSRSWIVRGQKYAKREFQDLSGVIACPRRMAIHRATERHGRALNDGLASVMRNFSVKRDDAFATSLMEIARALKSIGEGASGD